MKKSNKKYIIPAVLMIAAGAFLYIAGLALGGSRTLVIEANGRGGFPFLKTGGYLNTGLFGIYVDRGGYNDFIINDDSPDITAYGATSEFNGGGFGDFNVTVREKEKILRIVADVDRGDVIVKAGRELAVEAKNVRDEWFSASITDDALYITEKLPAGLDFIKTKKSEIIITVPASLKPDEINIYAAMGRISAEGINASDIILNAAMGNIAARDLNATAMNFNGDMGKINVAGDMNAPGGMELGCAVGSIEIKGNVNGNVTADCAMGGFELDGLVNGNIQASCAMGGVKITLKNDPSDFTYRLSALTAPKINGGDAKNFKYYGQSSGKYSIDAHSDMGSVKLFFK